MVMDESFFGEFNCAPSNQTVRSNPPPPLINGPQSLSFPSVSASAAHVNVNDNDDNDWGDFIINSGGLPHTLSLPKLSKPIDPSGFSTVTDHQKPTNHDEPTQPGSAPGRVNSGLLQWEKPKGALPLSIFGLEEEEEEEEEKSGASATSFDDHSKNNDVKKESALNVNDLIANLYNNKNNNKDTEQSYQVTDLNGVNEVELKLDWDPLNLNPNGASSVSKEGNFIANGANSVNEGLDNSGDDEDDDGWEFKDAHSEDATSKIRTENGMPLSNSNGFNANWSAQDLDFNGWNFNTDSVKDLVDGDKKLVTAADDDGWEFKGADAKLEVGNDKGGQAMTNMPVLNFDGSRSSWDAFFSNSNGMDGNEKHFNANLIDEHKVSAGADEWAFKHAERELQSKDENYKINSKNWSTLNSDWTNSSGHVSSLGGSVNPSLNGLNLDTKQVNLNLFDENENLGGNDGWEFRTAETVPQSTDVNTKDDGRILENFDGPLYVFSNGIQVAGDLFGASQGNSQKLGGSNIDFDFNSRDKSEWNFIENELHISPKDEKIGSDENSWAFKDAFSDIRSQDKEEPRVSEDSPSVEASIHNDKVQGNKIRVDHHKGALPLSFFGDDEKETEDSLIYRDISMLIPTSNTRDCIKSSHLDVSINDLISSLYSQAEQNDSVNHEQNLRENGLDSTETAIISDLANANHDLDDDSWEYQDTFTGAEAADQTSVLGLEESHTKCSSKGELNDYVQFFSKLKDELQRVALCHFDNLKEARNAAAFAGEDAKIQALDNEIQDLNDELYQDSIFSSEVHSDNHSTGDACLNFFIELLQEPKFQLFDSEYQLTKKLSLAESDLRSAIELLKCAALTLQILTSVSKEVQSSYVSAWFKMLSVCAEELRHGASIWKQSLQENVHIQILSMPQGKKYVLALGEIYRVVEVLGSSTKLYKPWILTNSTDSMKIFAVLSECSSLWSSSGLEESLQGILNSADIEDHGNLKTLLESIKYIHDLDAFTLYNHVISQQGLACQLSALAVGTVPGMKTVVWNGDRCFLTLANLWANLVSSDPPNLPCIHVG